MTVIDCTHGGDCTVHPDAQGLHNHDVEEMRAELEQWRATYGENALRDAQRILAERNTYKAVADAARYEVGEMWCLDGECDHATDLDGDASEDAKCPLIETRHATAAQILAVEVLTMSSDGDAMDDTDTIAVGELRRALAQAEKASEVTA